MQNHERNKTLLEKRSKPKKRMYNPYLNDEEYDSIYENKSIKEKTKNPFWVPSKNAEIFEVRNLLRQEKEKKRILNRTKRPLKGEKDSFFDNKNETVNNFHNNNKNINEISGLYLTETNTHGKTQKRNFSTHKKIDFETNSEYLPTNSNYNTKTHQNFGIKILENIKEKKEKESLDQAEKLQSEKLQDKIEIMGNNNRKDSVREYINKTRDIILIKYTTEIKKERAIRLKETFQNEVESIKDSIISMQNAKKLFEDDFFFKFERYVKYLQLQKEKEKNELNNLLENKNKLEMEVAKLENKITKEKEKLEQYSEYRDFLICIKERRTTLPDFFLKQFQTTNITQHKEKESINLHSLADMVLKTAFSSKKNKMNWNLNLIKENNPAELLEIERYNNYLIHPIFQSANELNEEIKKMEYENINLLEKLNQSRGNVNEMRCELKHVQAEENKTYDSILKDVCTREKYFKELKDTNQKLQDEKNMLGNDRIFNTSKMNGMTGNMNKTTNTIFSSKSTGNIQSYTKNKFNQSIFFGKTNNIFQSCLDLKINKKKELEKEINTLDMLKLIEKSVDFLLDRQAYYKSDVLKRVEWEKRKSELDKERKINKANEMKRLEEIKREQLKKNIAERNNRLFVMPKRKVAERIQPFDNNLDQNKNKRNTNGPMLADLLFNQDEN